MELLIYGLAFVTLFAILNILIWNKVRYSWLQNSVMLLIWSLPLEWFPRIDIGGAGFRLSQALVLISTWLFIVLAAQKNKELLLQKFSKLGWMLPLFFVISSPSWLEITNFNRFSVHFLGTALCFGASFLIASFANNINQRIKELTIVMFFASIFGLYQYIGDLAGIPAMFTGLREHYTKIVFGVPRVQGTAIEPLYFAGMLCIPIIYCLTKVLFKIFGTDSDITSISVPQTFKPTKSLLHDFWNFVNSESVQSSVIKTLIVGLVFVLTLSKGTFGVLILIFVLIVIFSVFYFAKFRILLKNYGLIVFIVIFWLIAGLSNSIDPVALTGEVGKNFVETLTGTSPSAQERNKFLGEAVLHIPERGLQGIGMGQYGDFVGDDLGSLNTEGQAIVNNLYVEVFLEEGILAMIWMLIFLLLPLLGLWSKIWNQKESVLIRLPAITLFFVLIGYYLQWNFFSPIFIMPIFILLGLAYNINEQTSDKTRTYIDQIKE